MMIGDIQYKRATSVYLKELDNINNYFKDQLFQRPTISKTNYFLSYLPGKLYWEI